MRRYGLLPERLEQPDLRTYATRSILPGAVDLRSKFPPVYDQGTIASCTANALVAAYAYVRPTFEGSRLFLYYNERLADGTVSYDPGSTLSQGVRVLTETGLCKERSWPYDTSRLKERPCSAAYSEATSHRASGCHNVSPTQPDLKGCLAGGTPFVMGIMVYPSFESDSVARTGIRARENNGFIFILFPLNVI